MAGFVPATHVLLRDPQGGRDEAFGRAMTSEQAVSARYLPSGMRTPPQASRTW
jgi:hypothetical protein